MVWSPEVRRVVGDGGEGGVFVVGHRLVDDFLRFAGGRARPNTVRAYAHDLKTFFAIAGKDPLEVQAEDVVGSSPPAERSAGAENVARISDGGSGLSAATIRRRLAVVSAFDGYLIAGGDVGWRRTRCRPADVVRVVTAGDSVGAWRASPAIWNRARWPS